MESSWRKVGWKEIETGLGSVGRLKILKEMIEKPDEYFTKYVLERRTGLKPVDVRSNLKILIDLNWVKEYAYDPKTYRVDMENEAVKLIAEFFRKIRY